MENDGSECYVKEYRERKNFVEGCKVRSLNAGVHQGVYDERTVNKADDTIEGMRARR